MTSSLSCSSMCISPDVTPALSNYSPAGQRKFPGRRLSNGAASMRLGFYSKSNPVKGLELQRGCTVWLQYHEPRVFVQCGQDQRGFLLGRNMFAATRVTRRRGTSRCEC